MAADAYATARVQQVLHEHGVLREDVLVVRKPTAGSGARDRSAASAGAATADLGVKLRLRMKAIELFIRTQIVVRVEPVLAERSAVRNDQRRRVRDARRLVQLQHVLVQRR